MIQKKYQVFISSTYTDLIEERKKAQEILLMADCIPAGMEAFVAANDEQFEVIKKVIDLCDYYILIIGQRYGSINEMTGLSYTEMEYNYAVSKGIPVLVFAIDESVELTQNKKESEEDIKEKLARFRAKAMTNRLASIWISVGDLAGKVAISIMKAKQEAERPGWIRGIGVNPEQDAETIKELKLKNDELTKENAVLKRSLDDLMYNNDELAFDDENFDVWYIPRGQREARRKITSLKKIFGYISLMMTESVDDWKMYELIANSMGIPDNYWIEDNTFTRRMCNQFVELHLLHQEKNEYGITYTLTAKGEKVKNELNLIKKDFEE